MSDGGENRGNVSFDPPIEEAIRDSELLLAHAASHGIPLSPELVKIVISSKQLLAADLANPSTFDQQVLFWGARNQLGKAVHPVTTASLKASTQTGPLVSYRSLLGLISRSIRTAQPISSAERSVLWFRVLAFIALFSLLTVQVYWVVGSRVLGETAQIVKQVEENSAALDVLGADDPKAQALEARKMALESEITIRYDILERWNMVWKTPLQWFGFAKNVPPAESPGYDDLQRVRLVSEFVSQAVELYLLPLLYGWLGACLYVLRMLAQDIKALAYTPEQDMLYRLRLYMGTLAGLIVVWFLPVAQADPNIKSLSVFAVALLVGYSVDLLFALMDRIIAAFTSPR
ncbi:MAG: hypothetical protein PHX38_07740 [Sulfuricella sp.]|nr:hypothetical protein [Sulfuricella sp.]